MVLLSHRPFCCGGSQMQSGGNGANRWTLRLRAYTALGFTAPETHDSVSPSVIVYVGEPKEDSRVHELFAERQVSH